MTSSFHIPGRFHSGYSLLGRLLRRTAGDVRRAEALLIVALTALALALLGGQTLAWALWQGAFEAAAFWGVQLGAALLYALVGLVGFQPPIAVTCAADAITLRQGARRLTLPYSAIASAEPVSALRFHRHWRRYAATDVFVNRIPDPLLLLRTTSGPVALGLRAEDHAAFVALLDGQAAAVAR